MRLIQASLLKKGDLTPLVVASGKDVKVGQPPLVVSSWAAVTLNHGRIAKHIDGAARQTAVTATLHKTMQSYLCAALMADQHLNYRSRHY
jgi:hypothetical protein